MPKAKELTGQRFSKLVVLERCGSTPAGAALWRCLCDCGKFSKVRTGDLSSGNTKSCCEYPFRKTHGLSKHKLYLTWSGMVSRCKDPKSKAYHKYGGRGITVCERWMTFENFLADMGERPVGMTLDRYPDNDGNYQPGNCRWATQKEQTRNTRRNVWVEIDGKEMILTDAAALKGVDPHTMRKRIAAGMYKMINKEGQPC